jgi:hypothetical protein
VQQHRPGAARYCIGGRFWQVELELTGGLSPPACDSAVGTLALSTDDARPQLRVHPAPAEPNLTWPLPLRFEEEIHCHSRPERRFYFADGWMSFRDGEEDVDVYVGVPPGNAFRGVVAAGELFRLGRSGTLSLHASALVGEWGGLLALGASGLGKSTLAAAWMHVGQIVSDDHVLVVPAGESPSRFSVEPFRADMYLRPDTLRLLPVSARAHIEDLPAKALLPRRRAPNYFAGYAPVAALAVLDGGRRHATSQLLPLRQADALLAVIAANSYLLAGPHLAPAKLRATAVDLVSSVPVFRLSVGSDLLRQPVREAKRLAELVGAHLLRLGRRIPSSLGCSAALR